MKIEELKLIFGNIQQDELKEHQKKALEIFDRQNKIAFIGNIVVKLWDDIEQYKRSEVCIKHTYDNLCEVLFSELKDFLDDEKIPDFMGETRNEN